MILRKKVRPVFAQLMRRSGLGQGENGIIFDLNMSGEMHMRRRNEVFGCIPHGRGAFQDCSERVGLHEMVLLNGKQGLNHG